MRVGHIIDTLQWGGAQKLLLTYTAEAARRGQSVTVIALNATQENPAVAEQLRQRGATVVRFPAAKMFSPLRFWRLVRFLRRQRFDVLQTHLTYANIIGTLAARLSSTPTVGTLHLAGFDPLLQPRKQRLENGILRRWSHGLVAVGFVVAEAYAGLLPKRAIEVIPNAVEALPPLETTQRNALREALQDDPSQPLVLSVGRLTPMKAFPDLVDAWAVVSQRFPAARLAIAGGGDHEAAIRERIVERGLEREVHLLGSRDDVPQLLQAADMFVSSSHLEGLPIAVLEALAAGLPIVATAVGDVPHVVTPETGIVVEPRQPQQLAEALIALLTDTERRQRSSAAARIRARDEYGPQAWVDRLEAVFRAAQRGMS